MPEHAADQQPDLLSIAEAAFLEEVQNDKRAEELSRMMSGAEITNTTLQHSKNY